MPNDISLMGVYLPPLFVSFLLSLAIASVTMRALSGLGIIVWFSNPPLVYFAFVAVYTVALSSTVFPS
jgi:hypothetical protein